MKNKGFTIVEILIAIALFSLLLIPIIKLFNFSSKGTMVSRKAIIAASLAEKKMEEYKYMGFTKLKQKLDEKRAQTGNNWWIVGEMSPVDGYPGYRRITKVAYYPNPNPPISSTDPASIAMWQRIQIIVEVYWKDSPASPEKSIKLFSIITNKKVFGFP